MSLKQLTSSIFKKVLNRSKYKYFTFREKDHKMVFLRVFKDGRVFFDGHIYDKDFFDLDKLYSKVKELYDHRNNHIKLAFKSYYDDVRKYRIFRTKPLKYHHNIKVKYFYPNEQVEWPYLTKTQYDILVNAYSFKYYYEGVPFIEYLKTVLYRIGWESIKLGATPFKYPAYFNIDSFGKNKKTFDPLNLDVHIFYEMTPNDVFRLAKFNEYNHRYPYNTYSKYISYNRIYTERGYVGPKYSTRSNYNFTDEEKKKNFINMIANKTLEKFLYTNKFASEIDKIRDLFLGYEDMCIWEQNVFWSDEEQVFSIHWIENWRQYCFKFLNDPRNILILPILDAYLEFARHEGHFYGDGTFQQEDYHDFFKNVKVSSMFFLYEFSLEYHEMQKQYIEFPYEFNERYNDDKEDYLNEISYFHIFLFFSFTFSIFFFYYIFFHLGIYIEFLQLKYNFSGYNIHDIVNAGYDHYMNSLGNDEKAEVYDVVRKKRRYYRYSPRRKLFRILKLAKPKLESHLPKRFLPFDPDIYFKFNRNYRFLQNHAIFDKFNIFNWTWFYGHRVDLGMRTPFIWCLELGHNKLGYEKGQFGFRLEPNQFITLKEIKKLNHRYDHY